MRMDRYEEENVNEIKQTRTNKNQELYTDVYLNNVYVDINNLKEVMEKENQSDESKETLKVVKENLSPMHPYQEKNYDIKTILEDVIANKKDDNLTRNLEIENINSVEIDSIIESINENQKKDNNNDNLLNDLMPTNDNTTVILPLEEPILDTSLISSFESKQQDLVSKDLLDGDITEKDLVSDDFLINKKKSKIKIILIILTILIMIALIIGFLIYKKII